MRDYAKIKSTFWTGTTGREIKRRGLEGASKGLGSGLEGVVVACYLMSSPNSNMIGLYYQPLMYTAHETGLGLEGASKGLQVCIESGFCDFDQASEMVWVYEMAVHQIAEQLSPRDHRVTNIRRTYESLPDCPFLGPFFDRYKDAFHLSHRRDCGLNVGVDNPVDKKPLESPSEAPYQAPYQAPSKPLGSQEQEQEHLKATTSTTTEVNGATTGERPLTSAAADDVSTNIETSKPDPDFCPPEKPVLASSAVATRSGAISLLIRRWERDRGKVPRVMPANPQVISWAETGVTDEQLRMAYEIAVASRDRDGNATPINAAYIDAILPTVLAPPAAAKPDRSWRRTDAGIDERGRSLGVSAREGESYREYADRLESIAARRAEQPQHGGSAA